jgi:flagellar protein FliO/FliZ
MELGAYFRFFAAFVFVLGLIGILALLARRLIPGARTVNRSKKRRLAVIEVIPVDTKRRLVLLRRDDTEHLVMMGPHGDMVVERNIGPGFEALLDNDIASVTSPRNGSTSAVPSDETSGMTDDQMISDTGPRKPGATKNGEPA